MTINLTEDELISIREAIEAAWSEGQCRVDFETLLKLGFKEDHYFVEHLRRYKKD